MRLLLNQQGITLIELLLVIALIIIIAGSSTPFLSRFVLQTNHDTAINNLVGSFRKAQSYAVDSRNDETWGVCITGGLIRLYSGSCGSPTYTEEFSIQSSISLSGLSDVTFNQRGEPSAVVTVSVTSAVDSDSVVIFSSGSMEKQ